MSYKNKLCTVLVCFIALLLLAGLGAFKPKAANGGQGGSGANEKNSQNDGDVGSVTKSTKTVKRLGGVSSRMPENSALVFFGSTFGMKLSSYKGYKNYDEALFSLASGESDAIWACDVTADFLVKTRQGLVKADYEGMADIQKTAEPRFSFGMALKKDSGKELKSLIDSCLEDMKSDGTLDALILKYVDNAEVFENEAGSKNRFYPDKMRKTAGNGTIKVGITGAVPPLELLDEDMEPYGFCVAMMDEIGSRTGKKVKFVYLDNETAFTSLMGETVDLLFTYGTGYVTTEAKPEHIMTDGYLDMQRYELIQMR